MASDNNALPLRTNSAWNQAKVETYLKNHVEPLRFSIAANNAPLILPLWFLYEDGIFWCASPADAYVTRLIRDQPNCGFDISSNDMPYHGIRGQGIATIEANGHQVLEKLAQRYLQDTRPQFKQWLLSRSVEEIAIRIAPKWMTAWDFSTRM